MSHRQRKYELQSSDGTFNRHIREREYRNLDALGLVELVPKNSEWSVVRMKPQASALRSRSAPTHHDTYRALGLSSRPNSTRIVNSSQQNLARKKIAAWSGTPEDFVYRRYPRKEHDEQAIEAIRGAAQTPG